MPSLLWAKAKKSFTQIFVTFFFQPFGSAIAKTRTLRDALIFATAEPLPAKQKIHQKSGLAFSSLCPPQTW
jgi:hypothetical protein